MEGLTKEKAIELHRKMWTYIADESIKQRRCVTKHEAIGYLKAMNIIDKSYDPEYGCFACDYAIRVQIARGFKRSPLDTRCEVCPLDWNSKAFKIMCQYKDIEEQYKYLNIFSSYGLYSLWYKAVERNDWAEASHMAREIASLKDRSSDKDLITKEEAIRRHREMYLWLYKKCLEEKRCVLQSEARKHFNYAIEPYRGDWTCEYAKVDMIGLGSIWHDTHCNHCPLEFPFYKENDGKLWPHCDCNRMWVEIGNTFWNNNYIRLARLYKMMANLPIKED